MLSLDHRALAVLAQHRMVRLYLRQQVMTEVLIAEELDETERRQALLSFAQQQSLADAEALERFRNANLLTPAALAFQAEMPLRLQRHCMRVYGPKAEARFLERKLQLDQVIYSLIRLEDIGMARELYFQLQDGEATFADLAVQHSDGPERTTRGIVGPVPLTQAHPLLMERLRSAVPGQLLEPFQVERWWLLVRLESLIPASFDASMAQQMAQELFEQWLLQAVDERLEQLRPQVSAALMQP